MTVVEFARRYVRIKQKDGSLMPLTEQQLKRYEEFVEMLGSGRPVVLHKRRSVWKDFNRTLHEKISAPDWVESLDEAKINEGVKALESGTPVHFFGTSDREYYQANEIRAKFLDRILKRHSKTVSINRGSGMTKIEFNPRNYDTN